MVHRLLKPAFGILLLVLPWLGLSTSPVRAQADSGISIENPSAGEALQGIVTITGTNNAQGFGYSEVEFAYSNDSTGTWFLIATNTSPTTGGVLGTWDTTTITDGNYRLRLRVHLEDGSLRDAAIPNLRVRNYTAVETPTPAPTARQPTRVPTITLTPTLFPTPTMLPTNAAILTRSEITWSAGLGGAVAILILAIISLYLWLRRKL